MDGDRFFYVMVVVIALIGVGLFAIPVRAHDADHYRGGDCACARSLTLGERAPSTMPAMTSAAPARRAGPMASPR